MNIDHHESHAEWIMIAAVLIGAIVLLSRVAEFLQSVAAQVMP